MQKEEGRRKKEEGSTKKEEGSTKKEVRRRKYEPRRREEHEGRRKKEEGSTKNKNAIIAMVLGIKKVLTILTLAILNFSYTINKDKTENNIPKVADSHQLPSPPVA